MTLDGDETFFGGSTWVGEALRSEAGPGGAKVSGAATSGSESDRVGVAAGALPRRRAQKPRLRSLARSPLAPA